MIGIRRAALVVAAAIALAALTGCQPKQPPAPVEPGPPTADRVAAARAAYAAQDGLLVGEVEDANERFAAATGVDANAVKKGDVFTFIDVNTNRPFSHGTLYETSAAGRLIIEYDPQGERAPRQGDLVVKTK
jgi:hypothetical protein